MGRKSDTDKIARSKIKDTSNTDDSSKKKRKRKERETSEFLDIEHISEGADTDAPPAVEVSKKKKRKKRKIVQEGVEVHPIDDTSDQLIVVDDDTSAIPAEPTREKKKRKKDKKGKGNSNPSPEDSHIDPALTALDKSNSTNAFLSAVVAAAAGPAAQEHTQSVGYPPYPPPFGATNQQHVSPPSANAQQTIIDSLNAPMSGEDLARALQGLDVAKLADALRALGDSGTSAFPLPGQVRPDQTVAGALRQQDASHHGMVQHVALVNGPNGQISAPSSVILGQAMQNAGNAAITQKAMVSEFGQEDHAHLLANKWINATKLNELTKTIGLQYKKGKFSTSEESALKEAIEQYRVRSSLSPEQLTEVIFAKGSKGKDNQFWFDITAQIPGRPVIAVYHHVRRSHHPLKQQGKWMPAEDVVLRQAVIDYGLSWEKVSERVGRMAGDCRDRWRNHIYNREGRVFGQWSKEEEVRLTQIVTEMTTAHGKSSDLDVFWTQVAARMGNTRGRHQCRIKWTDSLSKTLKNDGTRPRWGQQDAYILVHKIASLNVNDDSEIDWKLLIDDDWNLWSAHTLQRRWQTLKQSVRDYEEMSHREIMDVLRAKKAHPPPMTGPVRSRVTSAPEVPADAQATDVAIESNLPVPSSSGFGTLHAANFSTHPNPQAFQQAPPYFNEYPYGSPIDPFPAAVASETIGAGPSNVQKPNEEDSSDSDSDSD